MEVIKKKIHDLNNKLSTVAMSLEILYGADDTSTIKDYRKTVSRGHTAVIEAVDIIKEVISHVRENCP